MSEQMLLRETTDGDHAALEKIVRETWRFDEFCKPRTASRLARAYLAACLNEQTCSLTALLDGEPVGVVMGCARKSRRPRLCPWLRAAVSRLKLLLTADGRQADIFITDSQRADRELLKKAAFDYDGELSFFAVAPEMRGRGVGKALYAAMLRYFKRAGVRSFCLFTDTECDFGFYEKHGLRRRCEKLLTLQLDDGLLRTMFYLYDNRTAA
jgi:GNAT superfamily N-acetyltransferase